MTINNYLLTFEISPDGDELDIHCDIEGLKYLAKVLSKLENEPDHEHMMTPKWGGTELSEEKQAEDTKLLNKVTIHRWDN